MLPQPHRPLPWVGPEYGKSPNALSILVIGDSHYHRRDEVSPTGDDFVKATITVVENRIDCGYHGSFFSSVEAIIGGNKLLEAKGRSLFWSDKAFMNFIDRHVMEGSSPDLEDFRRSSRALYSDIKDIKPDLICLFSKRSWDARPRSQDSWSEDLDGEPQDLDEYKTYYPATSGGGCLIARFNHPRNLGRPVSFWQDKFAEAVSEAQNRRPIEA